MSLRPASSRLRGTWQAILGLLVMAALAGFMALEASAVAWERLDAGEMVVMYAPGYLQDAELFGTWAQETHDLVTQFLELESVPEVIVYLYPEEEWEHSPYIAYAQPRNRSVHFLTPSDNPHVSATWYRKNLIHEYSHVAVHHRVGRKFWGYRRLPEWFNEGLAEYIAVMGSDDEIQAAYVHYLETMREIVGRGDISFLFRNDVYLWGTFTFAFLEERFGHELLLEMLSSRAPTFSRALQEVTGLTPIEFGEEWRKWVVSYVSHVNWPRAARSRSSGLGTEEVVSEPTANIGQTQSSANRFFRITEPLFLFNVHGTRPLVQIVITSERPISREELRRTVSGPGLTPVVMANTDEIRTHQSEWASENFATIVRVEVPMEAEGAAWISAVPLTLHLQSEQTLQLVDVHGHWYPGALEWL